MGLDYNLLLVHNRKSRRAIMGQVPLWLLRKLKIASCEQHLFLFLNRGGEKESLPESRQACWTYQSLFLLLDYFFGEQESI